MSLTVVFNFTVLLICFLVWFGLVIFLRLKKKKSLVYLMFFTIFFVYIVKVLDYTLFQFQSLLLLRLFNPDLILNGQAAGKNLNLIPLITLTLEDVQTSFLNILLFVPFGFGLPFVTNMSMKKVVMAGALFSIMIELLQFTTGILAKTSFRIADINDVIFNTTGVAVGYLIFVAFLRFCHRLSRNHKISKNSILQYILERPQINK